MTRNAALAILLAAACLLVGCSQNSEPEGYKKENFEKRPVPAGYGPPGGGAATPSPGAASK